MNSPREPEPVAKVRRLYFLENGNVMAFDAEGEQVGLEQTPAWVDVIREKSRRGVVSADTMVMLGWERDRVLTVGQVLARFPEPTSGRRA